MPSGRFKGRRIESVPTHQLERLLDAEDLSDSLRYQLERELRSRAAAISNPGKVHIE